ncbi:hypothetical protein ACNFG0_09935 [Pseudomonas sp. NY15372]
MKHQFHLFERADTVAAFLQRHGCQQHETDMDPYQTSALSLQKTLLNLRQKRDLLRSQARHEEADRLAKQIADIETTLRGLPAVPTLQ